MKNLRKRLKEKLGDPNRILLETMIKAMVRSFIVFTLTIYIVLCSWLEASTNEILLTSDYIIEGIECQGNESIPCDEIRHEFDLKVGDHLDEDDIHESKIRLGMTGRFDSFDVRLKKGSQRGRVILVFEVREHSSSFIELEFHTASDDSFFNRMYSVGFRHLRQVVQGRVGDQDFLGTGKTFTLGLRGDSAVDGTDLRAFSGVLAFYDPHLFNSRLWFLNADIGHTYLYFGENEAYSDGTTYVFNDIDESYVTSSVELGIRAFSYSYFAIGVEKTLYDSTSNLQPDGNPATARIYYGWNSEDNPHFPKSGSRFLLGISSNVVRHWGGLLSYRKNFQLSDSTILTINVGAFDQIAGRGLSLNTIPVGYLGPEILLTSARLNFHLKRNKPFDSIQDANFFIEGAFNGAKTGLGLNLKNFGFLNFTFTYKHSTGEF